MKKLSNGYQWTENSTSIYMAVLFFVFPLFFRNGYLDIMESKTFFFVLVTCIYMIAFAAVIWLECIFMAEKERKTWKTNKKKTSKTVKKTASDRKILYQDVFFIIFLFAVIISTLCSGDIINAWYSPECKMFGTMILLLCCGIYCCISYGYIINKLVQICLAAGIGIVFILAILNRYGIDPLHLQSMIAESQRPIYISTIGNVNILANFICIFIPLFIGVFLYAEKSVYKIVSGLLVYTGVMAGVATNSDSFFLGFGAGMIFFLWFCMVSKEKITRYLILCAICAGAMMSLKLFNSLSSFDYVWKSMQNALINGIPWTAAFVGFALLAVIVTKANIEVNWTKVRKLFFIALGICFIVFILYVIKVNIFGGANVNDKLIFNEEWGTNRGFVWIHTCELFRELPLYKQVIGIGPGGFRDFFEIYNMQRAAQSLADFADPHSEVLYYLVSTGIIGMIGYFGMIISAIVGCVKAKSQNMVVLAAIFISWLAQGTVNNPLVFTTPYLFVFLAMARYELKGNDIKGLYLSIRRKQGGGK